jgi:hypothetical protein
VDAYAGAFLISVPYRKDPPYGTLYTLGLLGAKGLIYRKQGVCMCIVYRSSSRVSVGAVGIEAVHWL